MNEPKVRFKGFEGEWEEKKVGDVCQISTGKSNTQDKVDDGIYPFYVRSPHIEKSNKYLYDEEAVLTVGDGVGTGKVFHYVNGKYDLHQRVYRMFDFKGVDAKYFYYVFSQRFYKRVMSMTAKSSVDSVRMDMISEMNLYAPSLPEQRRIASYFTHLDTLIEASRQKVEKLKQVKAASLQSFFPTHGQRTPKIRFKGCEGEWKKVELGEIGEWRKGQNLSKSDLCDNGFNKCIHYGELFTKYNEVIKAVLSRTNIESGIYSDGNEILFPDSDVTPNGLARCSCIMEQGVLLGGGINVLHIDSTFYAPFISYSVNIEKEQIIEKVTGTTVKHINAKSLSNVIISVAPTLQEQRKIASYFTHLDTLLTLERQRYAKLQQVKRASLTQMFA